MRSLADLRKRPDSFEKDSFYTEEGLLARKENPSYKIKKFNL
jgi:hypothetical protein